MAYTQTQKRAFAEKIRTLCATLAVVADDGMDGIDIFIHRGFSSQGSDPITDEILEASGITYNQLAASKDLFENLKKFLENDGPVQANYMSTINQLRNDW